MPEWYLVIACLAAISALGLVWSPLLLALPLLIAAVAALVFKSAVGGMHGSVTAAAGSRLVRWRMRMRTGLLYLLQPAARLGGRLRYGLSPWRRRSAPHLGAAACRARTASGASSGARPTSASRGSTRRCAASAASSSPAATSSAGTSTCAAACSAR